MNSNEYCDVINSFVHDDEDCKLSKSSSRYETKNSHVELKILKEKRYIGRKFNRNWLISCFIICGLIIGASIFTVVIHNVLEGHGKRANEIPYDQGLVLVGEDSVQGYNVDMTKSIQLGTFHNSNILIDVHNSYSLFIHEDKTSTIINILNNQTNITCSREWNVHAFAVDYVTQKFYIIGKSLGILIVLDKQSEHYGVVRSDLVKPHDIVLDASKGYLFISQKDHSIFRSDMDGMKVKIIINKYTYKISSIAIDHENKLIFWSNDHDIIIVGDYEGENIALLHSISEKVISMTYINNQLFVLLQTGTSEMNVFLSSCIIGLSSENEKICRNYNHHPISLKNPKIIKSFSNIHEDIKNPCKENKNNCKHMCLLTSNGRPSCACKLGWQLHNHSKTDCEQVSSSVIYIENNKFIRLKVIENIQHGAFVDVVLPTHIEVKTLSNKDTLDFDYDFEKKIVYISDDKEIFRKDITKDNNQVSIFKVSQASEYIRDLALDWITKNLYFSVEMANGGYIGIINVKASSANKFMRIVFKESTYSLIIHPSKGYLYFTSYYDRKDIRRIFLNGTSVDNFLYLPYINKHKLLAFDYNNKESMVHWVNTLNNGYNEICNADLQFLNKKCNNVKMYKPTSLYIYKDYLYIGNLTDIYRFNKNTFADPPLKIIPQFDNNSQIMISHVKIYSPAIQTKDGENSCEKNNGECKKFCFSRPQLSCG